jgi:hypothetical protein
MSRGPTRRVRRLIHAGLVSPGLLAAAEQEANLLAHPYVGVAHLKLARLRLAGKQEERDNFRRQLTRGVRRRWWRPRGHGQLFVGPVAQQPWHRDSEPPNRTSRDLSADEAPRSAWEWRRPVNEPSAGDWLRSCVDGGGGDCPDFG